MTTHKKIKLHEKCIAVLDMIQTCEKRIDSAKLELRKEYAAWFYDIKKYNQERIRVNNEIIARLTNYYLNLVQSLKS